VHNEKMAFQCRRSTELAVATWDDTRVLGVFGSDTLLEAGGHTFLAWAVLGFLISDFLDRSTVFFCPNGADVGIVGVRRRG